MMFSFMDILIIIGAIIVAGILWKTIKTVAKILIVLAIAWVLLKVVGFNVEKKTDSISMNQATYIENINI